MKKLILIIFPVFVLLLLFFRYGYFVIQGMPFFEFLADYDTQYAEGFSSTNFYKVEIGMNREQVIGLLGDIHFREFENYPDGCFQYSRAKPKEQRIQKWEDLYWRAYVVCFDKNDKVSSRGSNVFFN